MHAILLFLLLLQNEKKIRENRNVQWNSVMENIEYTLKVAQPIQHENDDEAWWMFSMIHGKSYQIERMVWWTDVHTVQAHRRELCSWLHMHFYVWNFHLQNIIAMYSSDNRKDLRHNNDNIVCNSTRKCHCLWYCASSQFANSTNDYIIIAFVHNNV